MRPAICGSSMLSLSCGTIFNKWRIMRLNWFVASSATMVRLRTASRSVSSCSRYQSALAIRQHSAPLAHSRTASSASRKAISCSSTSADPARHSAAYSRPAEQSQRLDAPRSHCSMCTSALIRLASVPCCASWRSCSFCSCRAR